MSIVTSESTSDNQDAGGLPVVADGATPTPTGRPMVTRWQVRRLAPALGAPTHPRRTT